MARPTLTELAGAGAHFGHHRSLTFPKSKKFVYEVRKGIALINLDETQKQMDIAQKVISEYLKNGKSILFVGTRRSARHLVEAAAESINVYHVTERWFGGFLTNFATFQMDIKKMNELETLLSGETKKISKKERLVMQRKLDRFKRFLSGVNTLRTLPDLMVVASVNQDKIAIAEATKLGIPVIGITDTDTNPEVVDYPIPANDDSPASIRIIFDYLTQGAPVKVEKPKEEAKVEKKVEVAEVVEAVEEPKKAKKAVAKPKAVKETKEEVKVEKKPVAKAKVAETKAKTTKTKKGE